MIHFPPFSAYGFRRLVHGLLNGGNFVSAFIRLFNLSKEFPPFSPYGFHRLVSGPGLLKGGNFIHFRVDWTLKLVIGVSAF